MKARLLFVLISMRNVDDGLWNGESARQEKKARLLYHFEDDSEERGTGLGAILVKHSN